MMDGPRKWLPNEAYWYLVLLALAHRNGTAATKRELAWETRANHYVISKVLEALARQGHITIARAAGAHAVSLTDLGRSFLRGHGSYYLTTYGERYAAHFRYGRVPDWAHFHG